MSIRERSRAYTTRNNALAVVHLVAGFAIYFAALWLAIHNVDKWYLLVPLMVTVAFAAVHLYMLQHDCGHGALFTKSWMNTFVGRLVAPVTLSPYNATRYNHNQHHAHLGNLDQRSAGEVFTMTMAEYKAASPMRRLGYRLYRHPLTLLLFGPAFIFLIQYRFPKNAVKSGLTDLMLNNLWVVLFWSGLYYLYGATGLWVMVGCVVIGGTIGAMFPYFQHNFEYTYWARKPELNFEEAALQGSSVMDFGRVYNFLTANMAFHDLHHLNSNIPFYNLQKCHNDLDDLLDSQKIGYRYALECLRLKLWDEDLKKLVPFPKDGLLKPAHPQP